MMPGTQLLLLLLYRQYGHHAGEHIAELTEAA